MPQQMHKQLRTGWHGIKEQQQQKTAAPAPSSAPTCAFNVWKLDAVSGVKAQDIFTFPPTIADVPEACLPCLSLVVTEIGRRMMDTDQQQAAAARKLFFLLFNLP